MTRHTYTTRSQKTAHFFGGFFGWFLLNLLLLGGTYLADFLFASLLPADDPNSANLLGLIGFALSCLGFILNIGLLIYFGFTRYWIALGGLVAFAISLLLALCAALVFFGVCFLALNGGSLPSLFPTPTFVP